MLGLYLLPFLFFGAAGDKDLVKEYRSFVEIRAVEIIENGYEIDCADFACKLLADFCKKKGIDIDVFDINGRSYDLDNWHINPWFIEKDGGDNYFFPLTSADILVNTRNIKTLSKLSDYVHIPYFKMCLDSVPKIGDVIEIDRNKDGKVDNYMKAIYTSGSSESGTIIFEDSKGKRRKLNWEKMDNNIYMDMEIGYRSKKARKWNIMYNGKEVKKEVTMKVKTKIPLKYLEIGDIILIPSHLSELPDLSSANIDNFLIEHAKGYHTSVVIKKDKRDIRIAYGNYNKKNWYKIDLESVIEIDCYVYKDRNGKRYIALPFYMSDDLISIRRWRFFK